MAKKSKNQISIIIDTKESSLVNISPTKFGDSKLMAKELLKGNALIVNLNKMKEKAETIRLIDFLTGVLFTTKGSFKKISNETYLVAPSKELLEKFLTQFLK